MRRLQLAVSLILAFLFLTILNLQTSLAQSCTPPSSGLVAWYPAEGNANDIKGGNNGTLQGGATFANGQVGRAFSLDGGSGFVLVPSSPAS